MKRIKRDLKNLCKNYYPFFAACGIGTILTIIMAFVHPEESLASRIGLILFSLAYPFILVVVTIFIPDPDFNVNVEERQNKDVPHK